MGYASEIHALVSHHKVEDTDDDQLYYTKLFLDKDIGVSIVCSVLAVYKLGQMQKNEREGASCFPYPARGDFFFLYTFF